MHENSGPATRLLVILLLLLIVSLSTTVGLESIDLGLDTLLALGQSEFRSPELLRFGNPVS